MHRLTEASKDKGMMEDPGCTVDTTTGVEDMVAGSTATEATEAAGTATGTCTTPEPGRTAQTTENHGTGGTSGDSLETSSPGRGTTATMAGAPTTAIRTPEEAETAARNPEDGCMEPWCTNGYRLSATTPEEVHRSEETFRQHV